MPVDVDVEKQDEMTKELIRYIWERKYKDKSDTSLDDTKWRIARAAAKTEKDPDKWASKFRELMDTFLPGGRVINSLGSDKTKTTAFNCFVAPIIDDSMNGIFTVLHKAALTLQAGGGIGFNFSTLRPKGAAVKGVGSESSGPISFMIVFDSMCETIKSSGHRRGAMMAAIRVDHPDIEEFITAKRGDENKALKNFNLSVLVTDSFMQAVKDNKEWSLVFGGKVYKRLPALSLWNLILEHTFDFAEPGVIFIDRLNRFNNLYYCEEIISTNPCGEQPLPANGACNLGSFNMTMFVEKPFTPEASLNFDKLNEAVGTAVRYLDDIIDIAHVPLPEQLDEVKNKRRIGLGVTGIGDMLWMLGLPYGSAESVKFCEKLARSMRDKAYQASSALAKEKGAFPLFNKDKYLGSEFIKSLPEDLKKGIEKHGIRNSHLLSIAPTGTTSLVQGNISSGIEPIFQLEGDREVKEPDGKKKIIHVFDYAYAAWKKVNGNGKKPDVKLTADISPEEHINVMAAFQKYFDASISKTINFDPNISFDDFKHAYMYAYDNGAKGCTVYRDSGKLGSVIKSKVNGYIRPQELPEHRIKHAVKVDIPNEGAYEVEVTVVDDKPKEVWMHAPIDSKSAELLEAVLRLMSIGLRCNIDPQELLKQLRKSMQRYGNVSSPIAFIERSLLKVMARIGVKVSGNVVSSKCPKCGGILLMEESCIHCSVCEYTRCF